MADETTDSSKTEQVSICVCYVFARDNNLEIFEEFLGFCSVPTTNAEEITSTMVTFLKDCGLNMAKMVGKGFDGAANV